MNCHGDHAPGHHREPIPEVGLESEQALTPSSSADATFSSVPTSAGAPIAFEMLSATCDKPRAWSECLTRYKSTVTVKRGEVQTLPFSNLLD